MLAMLLTCSLAYADPPKVDADADGNIITVRPLDQHTVGVFDADGTRLLLPDRMAQPMWLVHPEAWRQAVAMAEGVNASEQLVPELKADNKRLEGELQTSKRLRSELRIDFENSEATRMAEGKMLRRSRTHWAIGTGIGGAALGLAIGFIAL